MHTAYSLNCLNQTGGTILHIVTQCKTVEAAISKAAKDLPAHCTMLKIVRVDDNRTVWEGTPQEAKQAIACPS